MICSNCGKEGIQAGDAFCRYCGFSFTTVPPGRENAFGIPDKKVVSVTNSDASKDLEFFGVAIIVIVALFAFAVAPLMGWLNAIASPLPYFLGAITLAGVAMIFIGFALHYAHYGSR